MLPFLAPLPPALSFDIVRFRRTDARFMITEISDVILLVMGEEEKHFGFGLHYKMAWHPQARRDGRLFKFEVRPRLYPSDEIR